jgi:sporulation protein YlmC with PRC-barrel domain
VKRRLSRPGAIITFQPPLPRGWRWNIRRALLLSRHKGGVTQGGTVMAMAAEKRETASLIGSDKVEGTNVYRSNGDKIGAIERIMLDKQSGKVAYAVMSFGGFLGIGHDHYPVPWSLLTYNTQLGGYEVNISEQQLKGAPSYANDNDWDWEDRKRAQQVYDYYRVAPYWM